MPPVGTQPTGNGPARNGVNGPNWNSAGLEVLGPTDFSDNRLNRTGIYVVCFGAAWCPVTRRFLPKFVADRGRFPGTLAVADITGMDNPLWDTFRIKISPSIVVFRDGVVQARLEGRRFFGITPSALSRLESELAPR